MAKISARGAKPIHRFSRITCFEDHTGSKVEDRLVVTDDGRVLIKSRMLPDATFSKPSAWSGYRLYRKSKVDFYSTDIVTQLESRGWVREAT